jgi:hypothetical protein
LRIWHIVLLCIALASGAHPQERGGSAQYIGGTIELLAKSPKGHLATTDEQFLIFRTNKANFTVPWERINLLEYGQRVNRRITLGVVVSPLIMLSKSRKHYLTIAFTDEKGSQQALVFVVDKNAIRSLLVSLEAKTNLRVEYQDEDARKAGKG